MEDMQTGGEMRARRMSQFNNHSRARLHPAAEITAITTPSAAKQKKLTFKTWPELKVGV